MVVTRGHRQAYTAPVGPTNLHQAGEASACPSARAPRVLGGLPLRSAGAPGSAQRPYPSGAPGGRGPCVHHVRRAHFSACGRCPLPPRKHSGGLSRLPDEALLDDRALCPQRLCPSLRLTLILPESEESAFPSEGARAPETHPATSSPGPGLAEPRGCTPGGPSSRVTGSPEETWGAQSSWTEVTSEDRWCRLSSLPSNKKWALSDTVPAFWDWDKRPLGLVLMSEATGHLGGGT